MGLLAISHLASYTSTGESPYNASDSILDSATTSENAGQMAGSEGGGGGFVVSSLFIPLALGLLIICTILGNSLVLVTIWSERNLRIESNYLLFSLALADLFVGLLVMPLGAIQIVTGKWLLGATWCEIWTFVDITCCSSSILHLLSVAIDRHLSVSLVRLNWSPKRNTQSIYIMITCAWLIAASVAACPLLGWKDDGFLDRISQQVCIVSQSLSFLFFGITVTFYLPLFFILFFYWRIWLAVRARHRSRLGKKKDKKERIPIGEHSSTVNASVGSNRTDETSSGDDEPSVSSVASGTNGKNLSVEIKDKKEQSSTNTATATTPSTNDPEAVKDDGKSIESKRFQRAAKTLAIITGAFLVCWSPRFLMLPIVVLCGENCSVDPSWADFTQWLGFSNSVLNPIIYTIFSSDFRRAFKKTLGRLRSKLRST